MNTMVFRLLDSRKQPRRRSAGRLPGSSGSTEPSIVPIIALRLASIVACLSFIMLAGNSPAVAATRYVDQANPQCSDAGTGSQQNPFCHINSAAAAAVAGDAVVVASGVYSEQITVKNSGTSEAPITFAAIDGGDVKVQGQQYGFFLSSRSWVTIKGFTISDTTGYGIYLKYSSHITVSNNHVSRAGLPISGYTAKGIYLNSTTDSLVTGNVVDYNSDSGIHLVSGSTRNRVTRNIAAYNARGYTRAAPGIEIRSASNTVDSNICHDNEDSGIQVYTTEAINNIIANNVSYNNGDHGLDVSSPGGQIIVGNAFYNNATVGINIEGGATNCTLANNIAVDNGLNTIHAKGNIRVDSASIAGTTMDYDLVYLSQPTTMIQWGSAYFTSLAAFAAAVGMEVNGLEADPLWVSPATGDFHLMEGSPAIDSADSAVSGAMDMDIEGHPRADDPVTPNTGSGLRTYDDRGPHEFQPPEDTTPPTVTITSPRTRARVSSVVTISANALDNLLVAGVQFKVDGKDLGAEVTTAPFSVSWDTRTVGNGTHRLSAVARDGAGNIGTSAVVRVTVDNPDVTPPTVAITQPLNGATVSRKIRVTASASDNVKVIGVQFQLDGKNLNAEIGKAPYSVRWDTSTTTVGTHTLTAIARDVWGNRTVSAPVVITVERRLR